MKNMTYEKAYKRLEEIAEKLDSGSLTLDESLKLFEEGVKISKHCQKMLNEAEKKVSVLMSDGSVEPFADMDMQ